MPQKYRYSRKGFTLIELLVVIGIIGILSGILFVVIDPTAQRNKAKDAVVKETISKISKGVSTFYSTNLTYPTATELVSELGNGAFVVGTDFITFPNINSNASSYSTTTGGVTYTGFYYNPTLTIGTEPGCIGAANFTTPVKYYAIVGSKIKSISNNSTCTATFGPPVSGGTRTCTFKHICANWDDAAWTNEN